MIRSPFPSEEGVGGGEALVLLGGGLALRLEKGILLDPLRSRIAWCLERGLWSQTAWLQILDLSLTLTREVPWADY